MNTNRTERGSDSERACGAVNGLNDHRGMGSFVESDKALLLFCNDRGGDSITDEGPRKEGVRVKKKCDARWQEDGACRACEEHEQLRGGREEEEESDCNYMYHPLARPSDLGAQQGLRKEEEPERRGE